MNDLFSSALVQSSLSRSFVSDVSTLTIQARQALETAPNEPHIPEITTLYSPWLLNLADPVIHFNQ